MARRNRGRPAPPVPQQGLFYIFRVRTPESGSQVIVRDLRRRSRRQDTPVRIVPGIGN